MIRHGRIETVLGVSCMGNGDSGLRVQSTGLCMVTVLLLSCIAKMRRIVLRKPRFQFVLHSSVLGNLTQIALQKRIYTLIGAR